MIKQFREFITKSNALALAIGVIIGAATGKLVSGLVDDLLMPIISLVVPSGDWRSAELVLRKGVDAAGKETITAIKYGDLGGTLLDFVIIAYVVFLLTKFILPKMVEAAPGTKTCPECAEMIPLVAKRCKFCTSVV
jgi:large conductance mechanosensitive channel